MKTDMHRRLVSFVVAETLLQIGFEKATGQSLSILTDLFIFYFKQLTKKLHPVDSAPGPIALRHLLETMYGESQYEYSELQQFVGQNNLFKQQIRDKSENIEAQSLLHLLKIIPSDTVLDVPFKSAKSLVLEEGKTTAQVSNDIELDDFFNRFVAEFQDQPASLAVEEYTGSFTDSIAAVCESQRTSATFHSLLEKYDEDFPLFENEILEKPKRDSKYMLRDAWS